MYENESSKQKDNQIQGKCWGNLRINSNPSDHVWDSWHGARKRVTKEMAFTHSSKDQEKLASVLTQSSSIPISENQFSNSYGAAFKGWFASLCSSTKNKIFQVQPAWSTS
jgi:hypothetical protein